MFITNKGKVIKLLSNGFLTESMYESHQNESIHMSATHNRLAQLKLFFDVWCGQFSSLHWFELNQLPNIPRIKGHASDQVLVEVDITNTLVLTSKQFFPFFLNLLIYWMSWISHKEKTLFREKQNSHGNHAFRCMG